MSSEEQQMVRDIIRDAKLRISDKLQCPVKSIVINYSVKLKGPRPLHMPYVAKVEALYTEICAHWGKSLADLQTPSRKQEHNFMRMVMYSIARHKYPKIPLRYLSIVLKRSDHTNAINALKQAEDMLFTEDPLFMYYYNYVKHYFHAVEEAKLSV